MTGFSTCALLSSIALFYISIIDLNEAVLSDMTVLLNWNLDDNSVIRKCITGAEVP